MRNYVFTALVCLLYSCGEKPATDQLASPVSFTVQPADEWTALFKRSNGWFGGDGIFAIPFSGKDSSGSSAQDSILFLFSDTMIGKIDNGALQPGYVMVNNSCMVLKGNEPVEASAKFLTNPGGDQKPASLFIPTSPNKQKDDYYWLGDGFVNHGLGGSLCIFAYRIRNTNDGSPFPFREVGNDLIIIPPGTKYPFAGQRQLELPFSSAKDTLAVSFGVGVFENTEAAGVPDADGYVYVYGIRGKNKELVAARIKPESIENFASWEFYNGITWKNTPGESAPVADSVSNELSVTRVGDGQYALIYQYAGIMPTIYLQVGLSPVGPFGPRQKVWDTSGDTQVKNLFAYNAKAHPSISKPGELIVSYNVNSFDFFNQIKEMPNLYRPRFVRIVFNKN